MEEKEQDRFDYANFEKEAIEKLKRGADLREWDWNVWWAGAHRIKRARERPSLGRGVEAEPCADTVVTAIREHGAPDIINSDQGSQFTSALWKEAMSREHVRISMDGKGRAIDNIFIERLWRSVKYEYIYLNPERDGLAFYQGLRKWLDWYNTKRKHQGIERMTPASLYQKAA